MSEEIPFGDIRENELVLALAAAVAAFGAVSYHDGGFVSDDEAVVIPWREEAESLHRVLGQYLGVES